MKKEVKNKGNKMNKEVLFRENINNLEVKIKIKKVHMSY